ncbi:MAG: GNAT family N-acetyltransferase [Planctomycetes bacterium]|nr:GNAT family N-acetyltransferase [Planctomycetota bacterium]
MEPRDLRWEAVDDPPGPDARVVDEGLDAFNRGAVDLGAVKNFGCFARLESGAIIGGALARRWGTSCELQQIWVDEDHRRRGIGRRLVELVEAHARARGCTLVYLDTFSFQAPAFYRELGYDVACEIGGFPDGSKFIMRKRLE